MSEVVGKKFDENKPHVSAIPKDAVFEAGLALGYGAKKYGDDNYKHGLSVKRTLGAAIRHIYQYLDGEDLDDESKLSHLGHAMASVAMTIYNVKNNPEFDDRFKKDKKNVKN